MSRPLIGAVSYLNTKPLVADLAQLAEGYEVVFDLPSRLADRLTAGELDVALIPVIEAVADPAYTVVSSACIACRGPVWSVKLMSRVPPDQIGSLALDVGSRTSRALAAVLLDQRHGVRPRTEPLELAADWKTTSADAALIIGDRAMQAASVEFPYVWDLGQEWYLETGLPFVFAVWAARPGADVDFLSQVLSEARDRGRGRLREIAGAAADDYDLTVNECFHYLDQCIRYDLGPQEKQAVGRFLQQAAELSLIPTPAPLQFHDCQTA